MYNRSNANSKSLFARSMILVSCLSFSVYFVSNSPTASEIVYEGLVFSATRIVPSVFPVMLTAEVLIRSGALDVASDALSPIMLKIKRNPCVLLPCLVGILCGFPVGARCVRELRENGKITQAEADRILAGASCASPAFVISFVGGSLLSSLKVGFLIWSISVVCSVLLSLVTLPKHSPSLPSIKVITPSKRISFSDLFCTATKSAVFSVLNVTFTVTFFYLISSVAAATIRYTGGTDTACAIASSLLEIGSGCKTSAGLAAPYSAYLSAFSVGFCGISVYFQVKSEAHGEADMRPYLLIKAVCGLVSTLFTFFLLQK